MKKKALVVSHSYFMLLTAIQLKLTVLKEYEVDIIISDYSNNSEEICNNLNSCNLFRKTIYAPVKKIYKGGNIVKKIIKTLRIFEKPNTVAERFKLTDLKYDELYFSNFDIIANQLYYACLKSNPNLVTSRFEEGYSTYTLENDYSLLAKIMKFVSFFDKRPLLEVVTRKLFLFDPDLYVQSKKYEMVKIESFSRENKMHKDILNKVFNYEENKNDFSGKYILFEESFFLEKEPVLDFELFKEIIDSLGKENVVIKLHPRNSVDRFSKLGYNVSNVKDVPWEIIQFNNDFSEKVLITISSGSTINSKTFFDDHIETIFLFDCLPKPPRLVTEKFRLYLEKLVQKYGYGKLKIPKDKKELFKVIK